MVISALFLADHRPGLNDRRLRPAFTLIELLVVASLLLILMAIAVMFIPNLGDRSREADGAAMLQGWLNIARTRAMRDQAARGLRLFPQNGIVVEAQYVDQPDDLFAGSFTNWTLKASPGSMLLMQGLDLFNGNPGNSALWAVQVGDYLEIQGTGLVHQITGIAPLPTPPNPANTFVVSLASALSYQVTSTNYFRIIRQPRVSGEERLTLPNNIGVDFNTNASYTALPPGIISNLVPNTDPTSFDILFAPAGNVIGTQVGSGANQVILWVRDYSLPAPYLSPYQPQGEPTLVTVNIQTGLVAAVPVDQSHGFQPGSVPPPTPYTFTINP